MDIKLSKNWFCNIIILTQMKCAEAYEKLRDNDVEVYSAKTDAFVIEKGNLSKAKDLLKFEGQVGDWRYSDKFNFPCKTFNKTVFYVA